MRCRKLLAVIYNLLLLLHVFSAIPTPLLFVATGCEPETVMSSGPIASK